MDLTCPACSSTFAIKKATGGKPLWCPYCGEKIVTNGGGATPSHGSPVVPAAGSPAPVAAAAAPAAPASSPDLSKTLIGMPSPFATGKTGENEPSVIVAEADAEPPAAAAPPPAVAWAPAAPPTPTS